MIYAEHLRKEFKKIVKEPGLKGSFKALFKPKKETVVAAEDISFHVPKGEILGFIGPNGAGKSTVIKMLTGILTPTSGECRINGKIPQNDRKNYVREIGAVFGQRTQLWWDLPLQETYLVLKEIYEVDDEEILSAITYHTTGKPDMTMLEKIIFVSDYLEKGRTHSPRLDEYREVSKVNLDKCVALILEETCIYLKERENNQLKAIDPMTKMSYEYYKIHLND